MYNIIMVIIRWYVGSEQKTSEWGYKVILSYWINYRTVYCVLCIDYQSGIISSV